MKYLDKTGLTYVWSKLKTKLSDKQDTLVSGTNIKTINNTSVLGPGNINISGGGNINDSYSTATDEAYSCNYVNGLIDTIYPVGSIYMSVTSTSPATLFGGTWVQIEDTFLLAAGTNHTAGTTGGEETHTLTTAEMPTHNHTFTGTAHSHGLNNHTHTYDKSATTTGASSGSTGGPSTNVTGSTVLTIKQIPPHNHTVKGWADVTDGSGDYRVAGALGDSRDYGTRDTGGGEGHTHTLNNHTHSLNNHTHSITLTSTNSGKASGNTADATQGGTIGNAGSGNAHNNMPPYLAVFVWKRVQ